VPTTTKAETELPPQDGPEKIAFLPFGKLIDQWRWDVFSGKTPADYNKAWWALRLKYQGVAAPVARSEADFDPGRSSTCRPIRRTCATSSRASTSSSSTARSARPRGTRARSHTCSIYGSKEAGAKLRAMLQMGASKPWPEALKALSGETAGRRERHPRVLRAPADVARGAEQGSDLRVLTPPGDR
jgi:peptidyl-dipeptidase A